MEGDWFSSWKSMTSKVKYEPLISEPTSELRSRIKTENIQGDRPLSDKPLGDRPLSDKPLIDRPLSDRPDITTVRFSDLHKPVTKEEPAEPSEPAVLSTKNIKDLLTDKRHKNHILILEDRTGFWEISRQGMILCRKNRTCADIKTMYSYDYCIFDDEAHYVLENGSQITLEYNVKNASVKVKHHKDFSRSYKFVWKTG